MLSEMWWLNTENLENGNSAMIWIIYKEISTLKTDLENTYNSWPPKEIIASLKKRWRIVFSKIETSYPDLIERFELTNSKDSFSDDAIPYEKIKDIFMYLSNRIEHSKTWDKSKSYLASLYPALWLDDAVTITDQNIRRILSSYPLHKYLSRYTRDQQIIFLWQWKVKLSDILKEWVSIKEKFVIDKILAVIRDYFDWLVNAKKDELSQKAKKSVIANLKKYEENITSIINNSTIDEIFENISKGDIASLYAAHTKLKLMTNNKKKEWWFVLQKDKICLKLLIIWEELKSSMQEKIAQGNPTSLLSALKLLQSIDAQKYQEMFSIYNIDMRDDEDDNKRDMDAWIRERKTLISDKIIEIGKIVNKSK